MINEGKKEPVPGHIHPQENIKGSFVVQRKGIESQRGVSGFSSIPNYVGRRSASASISCEMESRICCRLSSAESLSNRASKATMVMASALSNPENCFLYWARFWLNNSAACRIRLSSEALTFIGNSRSPSLTTTETLSKTLQMSTLFFHSSYTPVDFLHIDIYLLCDSGYLFGIASVFVCNVNLSTRFRKIFHGCF